MRNGYYAFFLYNYLIYWYDRKSYTMVVPLSKRKRS